MLAYSFAEIEVILKALHDELLGTPANFFEFLFFSGCRMSKEIGVK